MKKYVATFIALIFAITIVISVLPTVFLPKRWLDIKPGISRQAVHMVLGVPDVNYSVKGFDGWHNPFALGASVLVVRYDDSLNVVTGTEIKTEWGFTYKKWVQEYKNHLK